jgi:hypothetical protein
MMIQSKTNNHLSLINNHLAFGTLYICRVIITFVGRALQIRLFMQNKANFPDAQMNVNKVFTRDYENKTLGERGKNKANSKPNKANFQKAQIFVTTTRTKDYENKSNWAICENKPNTKPTCRGVASVPGRWSSFCMDCVIV